MPCLADNTVAELLDGQLSPLEMSRVESHIDACATCRELLAAAAELRATAETASRTTLDRSREEGPSSSPGGRLGRYVLLHEVGAGGMGVVYAAYDPELDRKVALKVLRGDPDDRDEERSARLVREAQAMAKVSHPNVLPVFDAGTADGRVFLAMEFVDGRTLREWLRERACTPREVLRDLVRAGRGLAAAHDAGLVHRDFKPDNVLVGADGRVRVTDFGLARATITGAETPSSPSTDAAVDTQLTRTGTVLGTPAYMAPEQHAGREATPESDQLSFAITAWEALYGERPFAGRTREEIASAASEGRLREPPRGRDVPAYVRRLLTRSLSPRPEDRHPSMGALLDELERDPAARRTRIATLAGAAVVLVAASFALVRVELREAAVCQGAERRLAGVWDASRWDPLESTCRHASLSIL